MPNVTGSAALGYWPAFWALGAPYRGNYWNWPGTGEFDIMENVNGINSVWGVLHCGVSPGGPCNETTGIGTSRTCPGASCQSAFHTYRFEWDRSISPNQLRWYVDGQQFHSVSQAQFDAGTWNAMTGHQGYFLLLNVAMGGAFPNALAGQTPTAATVSGRPMLVDYVAVWQSGSGTLPTSTPTPPPGGGVDARSTIQAERYQAQAGTAVETTTDTGGGQNVSQIGNGDWLRFDGVNFGTAAATQFKARVASGAAGGVSGLVQVRLDSPTAAPIGDFALGNTGGWQSWRTVPANIAGVTGTHTVYVTFTSGQPADFVNLNWITFGN
ncbi:Glycosyl hydrolases family 16 [Streptosporangium subroseum]|uniref:Glycosyl hydrolases family 16 n=1 Tax=Streptosporangium subroseum TaxID=106412 RepID=A0A239AA82_9ACTN|nr:carbohydrate-binding protein [Streptosporangium subroseum]SNR92566.1 Glycosyl hydrolases family 16 [Streptosporangium subroseum]